MALAVQEVREATQTLGEQFHFGQYLAAVVWEARSHHGLQVSEREPEVLGQ